MVDWVPMRAKLARVRAVAERVRSWLVPVAVLAGLWGFAHFLQPDFPIERWIFWRYLWYWLVSLVWLASCFSLGHAVIKRVLRSPLPVLEQVAMNFAVGLLGFFLLMFVGGLAHLYGPVFFVALPVVMLASGALPVYRYLRRLKRGLALAHARKPLGFFPGNMLLWGLGAIALFLFYLPVIVPSHIAYDSSWYHVPIGEHYARSGGIERFREGWFAGAIPHLPSVIYCYAFLLPRGTLFDYVELCGHLEFASLLMMLPAIPALVRRLAPGARAHASWVAFFIFPNLFWYDLLIGGDQFSAVWSAPICLALLRTFPKLSWRHGLLLACGIAGETLSKYSASGILAGPAMAIGLRMLWLSGRALWRERSLRAAGQALFGGLVTGSAVLLLTTPFWLKNWIWYGDPVYPLLHDYLHSRLWNVDAATNFRDYTTEMQNWQPPPGWPGRKESFYAMFTHAFKTSEFGSGPFRGVLFTLMCACMPFVRAPWRLWGTAIVLHIAIFFWFVQLHQDRYLMAFMPAMAAVVVAVAILAWRTSLAARVSLLALFAFHSIWGLGMFALGAPNYDYRAVLDFVVAAASGAKNVGMGDLARWDAVNKSLPSRAKVLVHAMHFHTGVGHPSVQDWSRMQGGISYGRLDSPSAVYQLLQGMGVTHLVWQLNWADDSISGDLRFYDFASKYTAPHSVAGFSVGSMPKVPPPATPADPLIAFLGCGDRYAPGLYPFSAMAIPNPRNQGQPPYPSPMQRVSPKTQDAIVAQAYFIVLNPTCGYKENAQVSKEFLHVGQRGDYALYSRKDAP